MSYDYDIIILGSGPAGFSCAMQSSKFDKKILIVEADPLHLGGAWINSGTVPSKSLREAASIISKYASEFGRDKRKPYEKFPMAELLRYKQQIQQYENDELRRNLEKNEIETVRGRGILKDAHTLEVTAVDGTQTTYTSAFVLISTGSHPVVPDQIKIDHGKVIDNVSLLNLDHVPRRITIIGSGINALEYATIFASLGSKVTILNEQAQFLPFLDHEVREEMDHILEQKGIIVFNSATVTNVEKNDLRNCNEVRFDVAGYNLPQVIETEQILHLGLRRPNTGNLGLEESGVTLDALGHIIINEHYQSSATNVYAAGDVIGYPGLASASFAQGRLAACHMFNVPTGEMSAEIPYGIYSIPELAGIGLTEKDAEAAGANFTVGRAYYRNLARGSISNNRDGVLKIVFENETLRILGIHIIGEAACDLIHIGQTVMALNGDLRYFVNHVFNYPTYAEAYRIAAFNGLNRVSKSGVKYRKILSGSDH